MWARADIIGKSSKPVAFGDVPQRSVLGLNPVPASRAIIQAQILRNQVIPSPTLEIDLLSALRKAFARWSRLQHSGVGERCC